MTRKQSRKFALWKRNLINNFVEQHQHERYEILPREAEMKYFHFPIYFLLAVLLSLHSEEKIF